jgi:hypothetical protein
VQANAPGRDPEAELQLQLARKLGLKKGKTAMGGDDGLDEFLEGERACLSVGWEGIVFAKQCCWLLLRLLSACCCSDERV